MRQQSFAQEPNILALIHKDMEVYDRTNNKVGTVKYVHFGVASEATFDTGQAPATTSEAGARGESWLDALVDVFDPAEVPEVLRDRLLRHGFVLIDSTGLFSSDRFAMPDQIARVAQDHMILNVLGDELIKR